MPVINWPLNPTLNQTYTQNGKTWVWNGYAWSTVASLGSGTSGTSGTNGAPGTNGTSGTSGAAGTNGTSGTSGGVGPQGPPGTAAALEASNTKVYDLYEVFGLNSQLGSNTMAQVFPAVYGTYNDSVWSNSATYGKAYTVWKNHYVPRFRQWGATIIPQDFANLDWGSVCHMEALWRGHFLAINKDQLVVSFNTIVWPRGVYRLKFPIFVAQGGMKGKGPGIPRVASGAHNCTIFQVDHNNWMGGPSGQSKGLQDRTPIRTPAYGDGPSFSTSQYLENAFCGEFTVHGQGATWQDRSYVMHGVGWYGAGEVSTLDRIYARNLNSHGLYVTGGPTVIREISAFDNNGAGVLVEGNGLGNVKIEQISGDDNGLGNLYGKNPGTITFGTIKHETGLSRARGRAIKNNPSIMAEGAINISGQTVTHAQGGAGTFLPALVYMNHAVSPGSRFKVDSTIAWNYYALAIDLSEKAAVVGSSGNVGQTTFTGTMSLAAGHQVNRRSVKVKIYKDQDGSSLFFFDNDRDGFRSLAVSSGTNTVSFTLPASALTPIEAGTVYVRNSSARIVAQVRIGADGVARFYDPNYGIYTTSPIGATGTLDPSTGAATLTFNPGEIASGLTVFYKYPNDVIAIDNGTGTIVGIPGVSGTINYTTGAYSITLPAGEAMGSTQNSGILYSSSTMYRHQGGGPEYAGLELKWKSGSLNGTVTTDWGPTVNKEYYGGNGRAGVGGSVGAFNFVNGTPTFDITNGLKKAYYNVSVTANTQVAVPPGEAALHTGIIRVYVNDVTFNNIGTTNKYLLDTLRVTPAGTVEAFVSGSWVATTVNNVTTSQAIATLANGVTYSIEILIPGAGITVGQVLGRTGEASLFFTSQPFLNDINLELFGATDLTTPNLQAYNIQFV
jgi:hypothetical protein